LMALLLLVLGLVLHVVAAGPSFILQNDRFVKDGQPIQILSACVHYARVRPELWQDRLERIYAMGANAIETYVPWNFHEEVQGQFNFKYDRDLVQFLKTAQSVGLMVLLRAGPYMCGEWEFGGLPAWLLNPAVAPGLVIRTYNPTYLTFVDAWWSTLFQVVEPLLYVNGGPIIMVQMENEFGSYGDVSSNPADKQYMEHLVSVARQYLGEDVVLYTTDGGDAGYMSRGSLNGSAVLTLGDFGPGSDPMTSFNAQNLFNPPGLSPPMCTEYYTGWLTHWGETMANTSSADVATWLGKILEVHGSVSLYMGHGGSNFGFWSGANGGGESFQPHITSYDYDGPVSEGGGNGYGPDGNKYTAVKAVFEQYRPSSGLPSPCPSEAPAPAVQAYGNVSLPLAAGLFSPASMAALVTSVQTLQDTASMEALGQNYGFLLYNTTVPKGSEVSLSVSFARDRVQVFVNQQWVHTVMRGDATYTLPALATGDAVWLLVENMGRINFGHGMTDPKGLLPGDVIWAGNASAASWTASSIPLQPTQVASLPFSSSSPRAGQPAFFKGSFTVDSPADTYLRFPGWTKGVAWVNGFNIGRYWNPKGPQNNLYAPASLLLAGANTVIVLEVDAFPAVPTVVFESVPDFSGPVCVPKSAPPASGDVVAMFPCSGAASQQWDVVTGAGGVVSFQSVSAPSLCVSMGPRTDPSTGMPGAQLLPCSTTASTQFVLAQTGSSYYVNFAANKGDCLDITSHSSANCAGVELYGCNQGPNQVWNIPAGQGSITAQQDGHCLTIAGSY